MALYRIVFLLALYYGIQAMKPKEKTFKTFTFVSSCMQNVTEACSERCATTEANQTHYAQCLQHEEVSMAYNLSITNFLTCVGEDKPCLRLNLTISYGEDCWGKCSALGYQRCLDQCKVSTHDSEEAKTYLQCALQMNPAHALFWKCLQQLEPSLIIEDPHAKNTTSIPPTSNPSNSSNHHGHNHPH